MQAFLLFLGLTLAYAMRVNLSVAIVAITDRNAANPEFEVCYIYYNQVKYFESIADLVVPRACHSFRLNELKYYQFSLFK